MLIFRFWWPYIMMIAPTIAGPNNSTVLWGSRYDKQPGYNNRDSQVHVHASYAIRDQYLAKWQAANVTVLGYFNGWELGQEMTNYPPKNCTTEPTELWRDAPCFIHTYLDGALCTDANGYRNVGPRNQGWDGDTELDPGTTVYREFLKTMIQNHLAMEPHFMGVASDGIRSCLNYGGDDGVSCVPVANGTCRPVQDGFTAWGTLMDEVGPILHDRDKLFSANTINGPRVHLFRHVDLVITEENAADYAASTRNAWLGLLKPVVMWTTGVTPAGGGSPDLFFQRLLHLGVFPMPPIPSADHSLRNGSLATHQLFLDYGPMMRALRGRTWVLRPHAIGVRSSVGPLTPPSQPHRDLDGPPVASLIACDDSDRSQVWRNMTVDGGDCIGAIQASDGQHCLEVQNAKFSPSECGNGGTASELWVYPCGTLGRSALPRTASTAERTRACPLWENIRWKADPAASPATPRLLRSAVPAGAPGPISWDLCLASRPGAAGTTPGSAGRLYLAPCTLSHLTVSTQSNNSMWVLNPMSDGTFRIEQDGLCVSSKIAAPPPPPALPAIANVFRALDGSELAVITSPGAPVTGLVEVTLRGLDAATGNVTVVRPGDKGFAPLPTVSRVGADTVISVTLGSRGAAMIRIPRSSP